MLWLTKFVLRGLQFAHRHLPRRQAQHLLTGRRGELEAYLYLRARGYQIVAGNFRVAYDRGEIDLIGWDEGVLCFIEVKTRTKAGFAPPVTAVDRDKRRHILSVARRYLQRIPDARPPACRFDVVSIVLGEDGDEPDITLHKGAFTWNSDRRRNRWYRNFRERHYWRPRK